MPNLPLWSDDYIFDESYSQHLKFSETVYGNEKKKLTPLNPPAGPISGGNPFEYTQMGGPTKVWGLGEAGMEPDPMKGYQARGSVRKHRRGIEMEGSAEAAMQTEFAELVDAIKENTAAQKEGAKPDTFEGKIEKFRYWMDPMLDHGEESEIERQYKKEFHPGVMRKFGRRIKEGKHVSGYRESILDEIEMAELDESQPAVQEMALGGMASARRAMAPRLARRANFLKGIAGTAGFLGQAGMAGAAAHLDYELTSYEANLQTAQVATTGGGSVIGATIGGIMGGPAGALVGGAIGGGAGKGLSDIIRTGHKEIVNAIKFSKEAGGGIAKELAAAGISLSDKQLDRIARDTLLTGTRMEAANERYVDRQDAVRDREGYEKAAASQKKKFGPTYERPEWKIPLEERMADPNQNFFGY